MNSGRLAVFWVLMLLLQWKGPAHANNRVLMIGIDGAAGGYFLNANTPNVDALIANGAARYDWLNEGALVPNPPEGYGASGVNWSTIVTGASAAHHGVVDNSFAGSQYDLYPHFFKYLKHQDPSLFTASIVDWAPINDLILNNAYADLELGGISDNAVRDAAVNLLQTGDPDAIFLHFDQVDAAGHSLGWGTASYQAAIQNVDGLIGNIMTALNARPGVIGGAESWLVLIAADHGGQGTSHFASQGTINWHTPFVISGDAVPNGAVLKQGTLRDVATTALFHMGVDPFGTAVDGKVVGLPFGPPNGIVGDVNQNGVVAGNGLGPAASDDVTAFVAGWMTKNHPSVLSSYMHGDLNLDRVTNLSDWIILNRLDPAMGQAVMATLGVPEPSSLAMAALAALAVSVGSGRRWGGRRRRAFQRASWLKGTLFVLATAVATTAEAALTDDLVGLYQFDGNFLDTSGSPQASHGTPVNGPQFASGKIGQGMSLAGVRDYMSLGTTAEFNFGTTTDFSIAMWIRQDDFLSDPAVLSNKNWSNGDNTGINWAPKGNSIFDLNTKAGGGVRRDLDTAANSASLGVGVWSLVLMTLDRDGATRLFINGVNTGTAPVSSQGSFNGSLPWNVGQDGTGNYGVEFTGAVDELAIWRRVLSPVEAGQLWNSGAGIDLGAQVVESRLKLVVNRDSGQMSIENNTGHAQDIVGYQITSAAGAFNRSSWRPIAGRLDSAGSGAIDPDDRWIVLTAANSVFDLSEASLGTGAFDSGEIVDLGPGLWAKYHEDFEDVQLLYADGVNDVPVSGLVEFVGGGEASFPQGDLNFDGVLDSEDWVALSTRFSTNVSGLSTAGRYRLGDLNDDGLHTLDDILTFRREYDAAHGVGAFAAMTTGVPEPAGMIVALVGLTTIFLGRRWRPWSNRKCRSAMAVGALALAASQSQAAVLFQQNFNGIVLGPKVDESLAGANVWSNTPPAGWSIDNAGVPAGGVTEWRGWSFASPTWWAQAAADQGRSQFTKATGVVAIADPDEWDDLPRTAGTYNSFLRTSAIAIAGIGANSASLRFDSSWLPEDTQTATITVSYDNGPDVEVLRWTSVTGDPNFKNGNTNETVITALNNPAGAATMTIEFGMVNAENDWWWAVDNLQVFTPLTLQVNVQSGAMKLLGDSSLAITGYEIFSPSGSLNGPGWAAGNLDAQNVGSPVFASADFNHSGGVNGTDLAVWRNAYAENNAGDADQDGDSDGADFLRWQRQFGAANDPASTWLAFLATESRLIESYLLGSSTFVSDVSLGAGYDAAQDARDLQFTYTTSAGEKALGVVAYVNLSGAAAVPEPSSAALAVCAIISLAIPVRGYRVRAADAQRRTK